MPRDLPLSNGHLLIAFDRDYAIRDLTYPHVGQENHVMGRQCRVAVQVEGRSSWVGGDGWDNDLRYEDDTLVARTTMTHEALGLAVEARDAVDPDTAVLLRAFRIDDLTGRDRDVTIWLHHDLDILESDAFCAVAWDPDTRSMLHHKRDRWFLAGIGSDRGPGATLWSCDARSTKDGRGVGGKIEDGDPCDFNAVSIGPVDAAIGVSVPLPAHGSARFTGWLVAGRDEAAVKEGHRRVVSAGVEALIRRAADDHRERGRAFAERLRGAPDDLLAAAIRSLHVLRTNIDHGGSVSAANDSDCLFPGRESYAYCWPRDGALVAHALDRAGDHASAAGFFRFCARIIEPEGWLGHRCWPDGTPGSSWLARVKDGEPVRPIQEDETSLVLWSIGEHWRTTGDDAIVSELFEPLIRPAAEFVAGYRNDATGLPHPSWDLWEERWGVHTFTVASVISGLSRAADMARALGHEDLAERWQTARGEVDVALDRFLFHDELGRYARCGHLQEDGGYWLDMTADASLCWLLLLGARGPDHPRARGTLDAIRDLLTVRTDIGGIARYQNDTFLRRGGDPDQVPGNPWVLCTLALAECELICATSDRERAAALLRIRWAIKHALPSGVLPEQVDPFTGEPVGVSPLTWSHGMMLGVIARMAAAPQPATPPSRASS